MKKFLIILALVLVPFFGRAKASEQSTLLIVEIQTASRESASEEFIEIYNSGDFELSLDGLLVQYKSANGENWLTKAELEGELHPRDRLLIASKDYLETADVEMSSGLAGSSGHLRIAEINEEDSEELVYDLVGWGEADSPEKLSAQVPEAGYSLKRVVNEDGDVIDTNDNSQDFIVSTNPSPKGSWYVEPEPDPSPISEDADEAKEDDVVAQSTEVSNPKVVSSQARAFPPLRITELLVDPDKPLLDAEDEFIEIYNPNKSKVNLGGYVLKTGLTSRYSYSLPSVDIEPGQYLALFSKDTGLLLSNSEGKATLFDGNDKVIFETEPYENAKPNMAWSLVGNSWKWSDSPSPNKPNTAAVLASDELTPTSQSSGSTSGENPDFYSSTLSNSNARQAYAEPATVAAHTINTTVLAGVGLLAILYAIYEYRQDLGNFIYKTRRYFRNRRETGPTA